MPCCSHIGVAPRRTSQHSSESAHCTHGVVVAPREQGCPCWRTECCRVKASVAQAHLCQAVEVGSGNLPTKGAPLPEPGVVDHDEENIGGASRGCAKSDFPRCRILVRTADFCIKCWLGFGQNVLTDQRNCSGQCNEQPCCQKPYHNGFHFPLHSGS